MSIPLFKVNLSPDVDKPLLDVLHSGYIGQGPKVELFEQILAEWLDTPHVLTLNAATSGLQLATYLSGGRPETSVISTPMTCSATNTAIVSTGANIIWADVDPLTGNIDPNYVEDILSKFSWPSRQIKAIMAVDWAGYPCEYDELRYIADKHGVKLIRDAAHAFGATFEGQKVGDWCDFTVYSFQAIKHLTTGDGGALICNTEPMHKRGKLLRWYGLDRESRADFRCAQNLSETGFKYHMNDINAIIGIENMKNINIIIDIHKSNGAYYDRVLLDAPHITLLDRQGNRQSAHWIYTLLVEDREYLATKLGEKGIATSQVHRRNDEFTVFSEARTSLQGLDYFSKRHISIPCGWWVTPQDREFIAETIWDIMEDY